MYPNLVLSSLFLLIPIFALFQHLQKPYTKLLIVSLFLVLCLSLLNHSKNSYSCKTWNHGTIEKLDILFVGICVLLFSWWMMIHQHPTWYLYLLILYPLFTWITINILWKREHYKQCAWFHFIMHHILPTLIVTFLIVNGTKKIEPS